MFSDLYVQDIRIREIDNEYYYKYLPVIKSIMENEKMKFTSKVTFLVGENGIGKSTLIEALAVALALLKSTLKLH